MAQKDINDHLENFDSKLIVFSGRFYVKTARITLVVLFLWFGVLKLLGVSAVDELIIDLVAVIAPTLNGTSFVVAIGVLEVLIGLTLLDKDFIRISLFFLFIHLILTSLPLFFLPEITWKGFLIPTLEGQYIIKNILIAVAGMSIMASLKHLKEHFVPTR